MKRIKLVIIIWSLVAVAVFYYSFTFLRKNKVLNNSHSLYRTWKECVSDELEPMRGSHSRLWETVDEAIAVCDKPAVDILKIQKYENADDWKYHIHPIENLSQPATIVTLGVGHDIRAEKRLIKALGKKNLQFFGADPIAKENIELYSKIGKFFPFAVGAKAGYSLASVLLGQVYKDKSVLHTNLVHFLTKMIGLKFYDAIWIDAEGAEYEIFPLMAKGAELDQNGVVICQMNVEFHKPDEEKKRKLHDILFQTLDEERYAFFLANKRNHLRVFFVNFVDEKCLRIYVPKN